MKSVIKMLRLGKKAHHRKATQTAQTARSRGQNGKSLSGGGEGPSLVAAKNTGQQAGRR